MLVVHVTYNVTYLFRIGCFFAEVIGATFSEASLVNLFYTLCDKNKGRLSAEEFYRQFFCNSPAVSNNKLVWWWWCSETSNPCPKFLVLRIDNFPNDTRQCAKWQHLSIRTVFLSIPDRYLVQLSTLYLDINQRCNNL